MTAPNADPARSTAPVTPPPRAIALTKIIATIGPASSSEAAIERLIRAGVSVFRLNFSHGALDEHRERLELIRRVAESLETPTAVLGDLQGPKIRVGEVAGDGVEVETGTVVEFRRGSITATAPSDGARAVFGSTYPQLVDDVRPGERLLINDGAVRMLIVECTDDAVVCTVTHGGLVTSKKGINLPDSSLSVSTITARDWNHVDWALEHGLDFLALSFVRTAADVEALRQGMVERRGADSVIPIIAKIEVPQAVREMDSIIDAADAIMIARGDLGVECDFAQVPIIQKQLIASAHHHGKPCIVATQMLESMITAPTPTRAEANDVASAIFGGTDAVMLSGETAVGRFPVVAVEQMRRIAVYTEAYLASYRQNDAAPGKLIESGYRTAALAHGVWTAASDLRATGIIVWSESGGGARYLSQNEFQIPIFAVTSSDSAARRMQLLRGVMPCCIAVPESVDAFIAAMERRLVDGERLEEGDPVVVVYGEPLGVPRVTDTIRLHVVGASDPSFT